MSATLLADNRSQVARPPFTIDRNSGPLVILAAISQAFTDLIGQATAPGTMAMTVLCPSWSVFDRAIRMQSPPLISSRSSTFKAKISERRSAPANPNSSNARSRSPAKVSGAAAAMARICSEVIGTLRIGATPIVLRMPRNVARTDSALVGDSWPASLCA